MVFQRGGCVYIMANARHNVLYVGVSSELLSRIWQHKNKVYPDSFTAKYSCTKLVYYAFYPHIVETIATEKAIKGGNRKSKIALIKGLNPDWLDLYESLLNE